MTSPVPSPCINVCEMDARSGYCRGCTRTIDEIIAWARLDDDAKRAVWALLPARRAQVERQSLDSLSGVPPCN
jgi:predicted Fe-S protein YdhL (DUF1289 family)